MLVETPYTNYKSKGKLSRYISRDFLAFFILKNMENFFTSFIMGLAQLFGQQEINRDAFNTQNQYNEMQWQQHGSPMARYKELSAAGLSDSAIGQALSGYTGAGTVLQSAPLQPTSISENLYQALEKLQGFRKGEKEIDILKLQPDVIKGNLEQGKVNLDKTKKEIENLAKQGEITHLEKEKMLYDLGILYHTYDNIIYMNDMEVTMKMREIDKIESELRKGYYEEDIAQTEANKARFKDAWMRIFNVPYDEFKMTKDPLQLLQTLIQTIGGTAIDVEEWAKEYIDYRYGDSNTDVRIYANPYEKQRDKSLRYY